MNTSKKSRKSLLCLSVAVLTLAMILSGCGVTDSGNSKAPGGSVLVTEGTGKVVSIMKDPVNKYIRAMKSVKITGNDYCLNDEAGKGVAVADYWDGKTYSATSKNVYLSWKATKAPYVVQVATDEQFADAKQYTTKVNGLSLPNLYMATTYYWKVENAEGKVGSVNSFTTEDTVRFINSGMVTNVRDLGGRMTSSGKRVKQGLIYRGAEMNIQDYTDLNGGKHALNLRPFELDVLNNQLKIKNEIDFRTDEETLGLSYSNLGENVNYFRPSIGGYTSMFCKHTSSGADYPEMRKMFQDILRMLATASEDNVMYFHCWGGADRTGTIGFIVNGLLGVSYTDLLIDFELTTFSCNFRSREDNEQYYNHFDSMVKQLKADYQKSEDETISQVMERYLKECVYLTDDDISALKNNLLEK